MRVFNRRSTLGLLAFSGLAAGGMARTSGDGSLALFPVGAPRLLPNRYLGANVEPTLDLIAAQVLGHPDDPSATTGLMSGALASSPAELREMKAMRLALTRFPSGSLANFYDWHSGRLMSRLEADSPSYTKFWRDVSRAVDSRLPRGTQFADYLSLSHAIGAEPILVANLETDTVESQAEWLESLVAAGTAPKYIELGNEFYAGLGGDPRSITRWKDVETQQAITKPYVDAIRRHVSSDVKIALPLADDGFMAWPDSEPFHQRWSNWNSGVKSEPWFEAVTVHPYCRIANLVPAATTPPTTQLQAQAILNILLAHYDEGLETALARAAARVPGKEIWVDEWNPRAGDARRAYSGAPIVVSEPIDFQVLSRALFVMLRQPAVTMSLYYELSFFPNGPHPVFVSDGLGNHVPTAVAMAIRWFSEAVNGGTRYQRLEHPGSARVVGAGRLVESYSTIEAARFERNGRTMLLVQNATAESQALSLASCESPLAIETMSLPNLADQSHVPAPVQSIAATSAISLPPYSLTRITHNS